MPNRVCEVLHAFAFRNTLFRQSPIPLTKINLPALPMLFLHDIITDVGVNADLKYAFAIALIFHAYKKIITQGSCYANYSHIIVIGSATIVGGV